jgi:hypothetical protein
MPDGSSLRSWVREELKCSAKTVSHLHDTPLLSREHRFVLQNSGAPLRISSPVELHSDKHSCYVQAFPYQFTNLSYLQSKMISNEVELCQSNAENLAETSKLVRQEHPCHKSMIRRQHSQNRTNSSFHQIAHERYSFVHGALVAQRGFEWINRRRIPYQEVFLSRRCTILCYNFEIL